MAKATVRLRDRLAYLRHSGCIDRGSLRVIPTVGTNQQQLPAKAMEFRLPHVLAVCYRQRLVQHAQSVLGPSASAVRLSQQGQPIGPNQHCSARLVEGQTLAYVGYSFSVQPLLGQ